MARLLPKQDVTARQVGYTVFEVARAAYRMRCEKLEEGASVDGPSGGVATMARADAACAALSREDAQQLRAVYEPLVGELFENRDVELVFDTKGTCKVVVPYYGPEDRSPEELTEKAYLNDIAAEFMGTLVTSGCCVQ